MPPPIGPELQLDRLVSADPGNGVVAVLDAGAVVQNLMTWDSATGDVLYTAPAGTGANTRIHRFAQRVEVDAVLMLGGATAAFVGIKRSGTTLEVRLADDSAYAGLRSQYVVPTNVANPATAGNVRLGSGNTISWRNAGNTANLDFSVTSDLFTFGAGISVTAGTTALQALTSTTALHTGLLTVDLLSTSAGATLDAAVLRSGSGSANESVLIARVISHATASARRAQFDVYQHDLVTAAELWLQKSSLGATLIGGTLSVGGTTLTLDSGSSATNQLTVGGVGAAGQSSGLSLRTGSAHRAWLVGANYNVADVLEFTASASNGTTTFSTPAMTLMHLGNQDSDVTLVVGTSGAAPTASRSTTLVLSAPHSGSFTGQAFFRLSRAGAEIWQHGIDTAGVSGIKTANTDYYWYSGGGYQMILTVGGALKTAGFANFANGQFFQNANGFGVGSSGLKIFLSGGQATYIREYISNGVELTCNSTPIQQWRSDGIFMSGAPTTASAANAFLDGTDSNKLYRSTSSLRYKNVVGPFTLIEARHLLLDESIEIVSFFPKTGPRIMHVGLLAEQVHAVDRRFTTLDAKGRADWVQYPHFVPPIMLVLRDHDRALIDHGDRLTKIERHLALPIAA